MNKSVIVAVAMVAFSFPAVAQSQSEQSQQHQGQNQTQLPQIGVDDLRPDQIRELQQVLNMKGFDAGNVDGIWGPETETAVRNFQREQGMEATGQPNRQTIYALGFKKVGDEPNQEGTVGAGTESPDNQSSGDMPQQPNTSGNSNNGSGSMNHGGSK